MGISDSCSTTPTATLPAGEPNQYSRRRCQVRCVRNEDASRVLIELMVVARIGEEKLLGSERGLRSPVTRVWGGPELRYIECGFGDRVMCAQL